MACDVGLKCAQNRPDHAPASNGIAAINQRQLHRAHGIGVVDRDPRGNEKCANPTTQLAAAAAETARKPNYPSHGLPVLQIMRPQGVSEQLNCLPAPPSFHKRKPESVSHGL